jgi:hypothetical protein
MNRVVAAVVMAVVAGTASELRAQVGYDPGRSPFRDLRETQEITFFSGYYRAKKDPARIAPQSAPMVGALYQWRAAGPANLYVSTARVASERNVLDPEQAANCATATTGNCKLAGTFRWPVYLLDVGLAFGLTGARSFHHLVPELKAGLGIAEDFHTQPDLGDFAFGTRFAFNWGAGIRWVPGGRYQVRADLVNHTYTVKYPAAYYQPAPDGSTIFTTAQSRSAWLNNPGISIGISYLFSR